MTSPPLSPIQEKALDLQSRIQAGEDIPPSELQQFIIEANQSLKSQRKQSEAPDSTADFF